MVLYDYDWASANDEIGRAFVRVSDLQPGQERDLWLEVSSESERGSWGRGLSQCQLGLVRSTAVVCFQWSARQSRQGQSLHWHVSLVR